MTKAAVALVPLVAIPVLAGGAASRGGAIADTAALSDIPPAYARLYLEASSRFRFSWQLLAGVGKVECDHGRGDCYKQDRASAAIAIAALGPMQFLPKTWASYKTASGKPPFNVYDATDAIFAAAAKLSSDSIKTDPRGALFSYNPSWAYVDKVMSFAHRYGWIDGRGGDLASAVVSHPNIGLRPEARTDVVSGRVDARILADLLILATEHRLEEVGPFVTGHSIYVAGTDRISNHAYGRAVDIAVVDGEPVSPTNKAARRAALMLLSLPGPLRPDEVGSPWDFAAPGSFSDPSHLDHLHVSTDPYPPLKERDSSR